jgi:hypothetical protein
VPLPGSLDELRTGRRDPRSGDFRFRVEAADFVLVPARTPRRRW